MDIQHVIQARQRPPGPTVFAGPDANGVRGDLAGVDIAHLQPEKRRRVVVRYMAGGPNALGQQCGAVFDKPNALQAARAIVEHLGVDAEDLMVKVLSERQGGQLAVLRLVDRDGEIYVRVCALVLEGLSDVEFAFALALLAHQDTGG